ncbi:heat shock protein 68-like [Amyelois transitella]|uniref:heat shock protein 68-like n=1 Tax=Amyelois transitella TaxID=680683 RepID=UPI002990604F|nr:heat shock protein 68-like [Amyelois transitella]XP_060808501.1 heat shock protein 68-like [Amyelois transitella]
MVAIGIDLGTTFSCAAVWRHGNVEVIVNEQGNKTTPSYVAFTSSERLIGEPAKYQAPFNPCNTVFGAKRLIGRRYDDLGVQMDLRHWPYKVANENGKPVITVEYKDEKKKFAPEEISGMILSKMKQSAEAYLGCEVDSAVITVPAYFNDSQRSSTRVAGTLAGLKVLRIINEPTAAALAYGLENNLKGEKNVLIFDLGGGTLDVSILTIAEGSVFEVKATAGNTRLGGEDFDNRLVAYFAEDFRKTYNIEIIGYPRPLRRLKSASERTKKFLTSATEATVDVESLYDGIDYHGKISRSLFEELCSDLFRDTLVPVQQALQDAKMTKDQINEIILVGGSTRIPKIRSMLKEFFNKPLNASINPDEAVAYGAAIQAAKLSGQTHEKIQDILLLDVVPLSLGVEAARGLMCKVVDRNTLIPCRLTKDLTTLDDNQVSMTIEVFEGERSLTKDNNLLGVFDLNGIPPAPRGIPKIDVTFDIDVNGILTVSAKDRSTGNSEKIIIRNEHRLTKDEIAKMLEDAEFFKEEDKERRMCLEARNQLENYVYQVKNTIAEKGDKMSVEEKVVMDTEIEEAMEWLDKNTDCLREEYERKMTELMKRWSDILKQFYGHILRHKAKRQRSETYQATLDQESTSVDELHK